MYSGDGDDEYEKGEDYDDDFFPNIDCDALTSCEWDGMHSYFIGDGVCHDFGCYNHKICKYDGGDCCADTCDHTSPYYECGQDHYWCRDPESKNCNPDLSRDCPGYNGTTPSKPVPDCDGSKAVYSLGMYDTFGDGWDNTELTVLRRDTELEVYKGSLATGYDGEEYLCLEAGCYTVKVSTVYCYLFPYINININPNTNIDINTNINMCTDNRRNMGKRSIMGNNQRKRLSNHSRRRSTNDLHLPHRRSILR